MKKVDYGHFIRRGGDISCKEKKMWWNVSIRKSSLGKKIESAKYRVAVFKLLSIDLLTGKLRLESGSLVYWWSSNRIGMSGKGTGLRDRRITRLVRVHWFLFPLWFSFWRHGPSCIMLPFGLVHFWSFRLLLFELTGFLWDFPVNLLVTSNPNVVVSSEIHELFGLCNKPRIFAYVLKSFSRLFLIWMYSHFL